MVARLQITRVQTPLSPILKAQVKYGMRSPKFIWAPVHQLYPLAESPQLPPSTRNWAYSINEGIIGQPRYTTSLCKPLIKCIELRESQYIPCATIKRRGAWVISLYCISDSYRVICMLEGNFSLYLEPMMESLHTESGKFRELICKY
jgi:hypothetical protein